MPDRLLARLGPVPSGITGVMREYLQRIANRLNQIPNISYTSFNGGPNSNLTGAPGDMCINIVASAQTKRLYIKELGSSNTGWVSVSTTP